MLIAVAGEAGVWVAGERARAALALLTKAPSPNSTLPLRNDATYLADQTYRTIGVNEVARTFLR